MEDKRDKWSKTLKSREKEFKMPVDDHVWERIAAGLPGSTSVQTKTKIRWIVSSVAAILLVALLVGGLFFLPGDRPDNRIAQQKGPEPQIPGREQQLPSIDSSQTQQELPAEAAMPSKGKAIRASAAEPTEIKTPETIGTQAVREQKEPTEEVNNPPHRTPDKKEQADRQAKEEEFMKAGSELPDLWKQSGKKKKAGKMAFALAMGNQGSSFTPSVSFDGSNVSGMVPTKTTLAGESVSSNALNLSEMFQQNDRLDANTGLYDDVPSTSEIDYKTPVTFSLLFRKYLSGNRWAVETGISYTRLESTEKIGYDHRPGFSKDIELDYFGIPLKVVYDIYQTDRLSVYITAGGMFEKSFRGKEVVHLADREESNNLDISELQWSLMGNVGVNYRLVKHAGLFLEPGVQYYFDDGNSLNTIRKDKPFNWGVQAGFRLAY